MPDLKHPLMGARLSTLLAASTRLGGVDRKHWPAAAGVAGAAIARLPFTLIEDLFCQGTGAVVDQQSEPLFIVGHWRSGTTHLHNLLSLAPEFGVITPLASGLPNELLTLASWLRPLLEKSLPSDRGVDAVAVTADSPQEDEIPMASMQLLSVFHAVYFPQKFRERFYRTVFFDGVSEGELAAWRRQLLAFYRKITHHQGGRPPLIKNPAHTARVAQLLKIWPRARFLHIYRNPYTVYASTLHYYRKLLPQLAWQDYSWPEVEQTVVDCYPRLFERLYTDTANLPAGAFMEISFEELEANPLSVIEHIADSFQLADQQQLMQNVEGYLTELRGYRKNELACTAVDQLRVERSWGLFLQRWDYQPPD